MKTYTIQYSCDNCGCSTSKSYQRGHKASATIQCDNCGCLSKKNVGVPKEPKDEINPWDKYIPQPEKDPFRPWPVPWKDIYDKNPWGPPYKLPYTSPNSTNDNYYDGHWTICRV